MTISIQKIFWNLRALVVIFTTIWLSGCIGMDAFPIAARAGDTITLALGSPEGMTRTNTSVSFEDAQGGIHDLTTNIRGIFKMYPDPASMAWDSSATYTLVSSAKHEPWLSVMALDLPLSLPTGPGTIHVTSTADYPAINAHINDVPIRLEIMPGTGTPNPLEYIFGNTSANTTYGNLQSLEPRTSVAIYMNGGDSTLFGAIEMKLHIETDKGTNLAPANVRVLMEDLMIISESQRNWFWNLDNGQDYTVTLISPLGWLAEYEARFKIVFKQASVVGTPTITSIRYFDINGTEVVGPTVNQYIVKVNNG